MVSSVKEIATTLRYLATALVAWEETPPDKRDRIPQSLRLGMSTMYAAAALSGTSVPTTVPELFELADRPLKSWWKHTKDLSTIPDKLLFHQKPRLFPYRLSRSTSSVLKTQYPKQFASSE